LLYTKNFISSKCHYSKYFCYK